MYTVTSKYKFTVSYYMFTNKKIIIIRNKYTMSQWPKWKYNSRKQIVNVEILLSKIFTMCLSCF